MKITKSRLKEIVREELEQVREYGSKLDPSVDRRIQSTENDIRALKSDTDKIRQTYAPHIGKLRDKVRTIEDNLELIAKKLGVKLSKR